MKKRFRQIEVFNLSALDLFASGFGAFIVLTIVLLPYFPNESQERVAQLRAEIARQEQELRRSRDLIAQLERQREEQNRRIAALQVRQLPPVDVIVALDVTGSMGGQIEALKREIGSFLGIISLFSPSAAIGIVAFGDSDYPTASPLNPTPITRVWPCERLLDPRTGRCEGRLAEVRPGSPLASQLQSFVNSIQIDFGRPVNNRGAEEAVDIALENAIGLEIGINSAGLRWRSESQRRVVVIITDHATRDREGETYVWAERFAQRDGSRVSTVWVNPGGGRGEQYLGELARRGKGSLVPFTDSVTLALVRALLE